MTHVPAQPGGVRFWGFIALMTALTLLFVVLGVWPAPLLDLIAGSVGRIAGLFGA